MTAQLSREIIENLLQHNDESDSPANAEAWEVNALCRLALAGLDSEPVAYFYPGDETEWQGVALAELEARTVSVKLPQGIVMTKTLVLPVQAKEFCEYIDAMKWQCFEAIAKDCAAAGIKLEVGE